ncbi:MAG: PAAR domain-containing protein, partial [Polyangiaceae bacterium]|nr:PAAR domain-containing protein [Polyangiaceae bacterium]
MGESKLLEAARLYDPVKHSLSFAGAILGALAGIVLGALLVAATILTGGGIWLIIGAVGLALSGTAFLSGLGEWLFSFIPNSCDGVKDGARSVRIGDRRLKAARAGDPLYCHDGQKIAFGNERIFIEGKNASRKEDETQCAGKIEKGCPTVFYGGVSIQILEKRVGGELPPWFWYGREVVDWAGTILGFLGPRGLIMAGFTLFDKLSTATFVVDKALTYTATIAEQMGNFELASNISAVTNHPAYRVATLGMGATG